MQVTSACVDVVPLFLGTGFDFQIDDEELIVSCSPSLLRDGKSRTELTVCLQHIPTGISVQSSGTLCTGFFCTLVRALKLLCLIWKTFKVETFSNFAVGVKQALPLLG